MRDNAPIVVSIVLYIYNLYNIIYIDIALLLCGVNQEQREDRVYDCEEME